MSIIATPLFLIAKSNIKYPFFPKYQQVIGTNREVYERVLALFFLQQLPGLSNRCTFAFDQPTGWYFIPATELELNMYCPSPLGDLVWHLITQVNNMQDTH